MRHSLSELLEELERTRLNPETAKISELAEMMEKRQRILKCVQKADASSLSQIERKKIADRVSSIRKRDQQFAQAIQKRMADIHAALERLVDARAAVRGYRPVHFPTPALVSSKA